MTLSSSGFVRRNRPHTAGTQHPDVTTWLRRQRTYWSAFAGVQGKPDGISRNDYGDRFRGGDWPGAGVDRRKNSTCRMKHNCTGSWEGCHTIDRDNLVQRAGSARRHASDADPRGSAGGADRIYPHIFGMRRKRCVGGTSMPHCVCDDSATASGYRSRVAIRTEKRNH